MTEQPPVTQSKPIRSFHVVMKAVGSRCNLDCGYCYYLGKEDSVPGLAAGRMSDELLEEFTRQYISQQDVDSVLFNWHGGEPALLGLDFFRRAVQLQQKYAGNKRIENDFHTNGTLLDDEWCEFFKQNNFWIGLSIDGPPHLNDRVRCGKDGSPTCEQVICAARLLQKHEVSFNPLTVVSSANAKHPEEVYGFLTEELGCTRLQWLPCVQRKDFRTVASGRWDESTMPVKGTSAARPARLGCYQLVGGSRRLGRVPLPHVRPLAAKRFWKGNRQLVRIVRGPIDGAAGKNLFPGRRLWPIASHNGPRRQHLLLRPLRLPGTQTGQHPRRRPPACRHGVFRSATRVRHH